MFSKFASLLLCLTLSSCGVSEAEIAARQNPNNIRADQHVVLDNPLTFACQFDHDFKKALEHLSRREISAYSQITLNEPLCFQGEPGLGLTVLSIRGEIATVAVTTLSDYDRLTEPQRGRYKRQFLTAAKWIRPG